jgi:hypothetical protein
MGVDARRPPAATVALRRLASSLPFAALSG